MKSSRWVTSYYHPFVGVVVKCEACGRQVNKEAASKHCGGCGAAMTNADDTIFPGHFQALDDFARD